MSVHNRILVGAFAFGLALDFWKSSQLQLMLIGLMVLVTAYVMNFYDTLVD